MRSNRLLVTVAGFALMCCTGICAAQVALSRISVQQISQPSPGPPWDHGAIVITANGTVKTIPYGQFSSPASIASTIAAYFSQDCLSPVVARASGSTVAFYARQSWLTSVAVTSSVAYDTQDFAHASFAVSAQSSPSASTTTLAVVPASAPIGTPITLAVAVNPSPATGSVTFMDGSSMLGTIIIAPNMTTSLVTGTLLAGNHSITALYSGDGVYASSSSPAATVSIQGPSQSSGTNIADVRPAVAPPGAAPIAISGSGFSNTAGQLLLNGNAISVLTWSDNSITFQVPANASTGPLRVVSGANQSNEFVFTVTPALACPVY